MPKFSVIIPVYKVEKYVRQCIESVLNQYYQDFEAIVVDDCGQDNSINIVKEYAQKDSRIKIVNHKKNMGLAQARNTALKLAKGEYIVCLDSDDWMEPNCLSVVNDTFRKYNTTSVWFNAKKYYENTKSFDSQPMYKHSDGFRILTPANIAAFADFTWIKAYTRESIQKYNLGWPMGLTFEDGEFYFKYFTHNPKTYVINDCLINYRYRDDSIVRQADRGNIKINDVYTVLRHLKKFWTKLGVYERYKPTMLKLIQNRVRMCYGLNYSKDNKKLSYKIIKDLNYPDDFKYCKPADFEYNPLVTVVVPIYNVEKYIAECFDSIINQTYNNLEILCIDDCGQDNSINIVKQYIKKDSRIKLLRHKKNKGLGGARNTGLKNANGKYIFFVDSDDYINVNCIRTVVNKLQETDLNVVFFKADVYNQYKQIKEPIWYKKYYEYPEGSIYFNENNICDIPCYSWNKGYKTDFLRKNNLYWSENIIYEDVEFSFKIFTRFPESYMIDKVLYTYRIREGSIINNCYNKHIRAQDLYEVHKKIYDYLVKYNLMDKFMPAYLELVMISLNNYRNTPELHKKMVPYMLEYLDYINFPNLYHKEGLCR